MSLITSRMNQVEKQSAESSRGPPVDRTAADVGQFGCCPSVFGEGVGGGGHCHRSYYR